MPRMDLANITACNGESGLVLVFAGFFSTEMPSLRIAKAGWTQHASRTSHAAVGREGLAAGGLSLHFLFVVWEFFG